jgi:hypothetical protein
LPILSRAHHIILQSLPDDDLEFFDRVMHVTPNLNRLTVYFDDLLKITHVSQHNLCQLLQARIYQLEIRLDYPWSPVEIRRDIPKIIRIFSNIKSITILFHPTQKRSLLAAKEVLIQLLKHPTNLLCIHMNSSSSTCFEQLQQNGIETIKNWLTTSSNTHFKYQHNTVHIQLNSSSITILL